MKTIGILGGMGPQASVRFYDLLIRKSKERGAVHNDDYPHILLSSLPVPDLITSKDAEEDAVIMVEEEARRLAAAGAEFLVMPCNTMHLYLDRYRKASGLGFVSMVDAVADRVASERRSNVAVLGSLTTMRSGLYEYPLGARGVNTISLPWEEQSAVAAVILSVIAGQAGSSQRSILRACIECLAKKGAEAVVLGCTELPLLLPMQTPIPLYDSLEVLADAAIVELFR